MRSTSLKTLDNFPHTQVKKSKKWACKVCGEKQSVKKVYAQGTGQECRRHVQKLNMKCGEAQMVKDFNSACDSDDDNDHCKFTENTTNVTRVEPITSDTTHEDVTRLSTGESKWKKFIEVTSSDYSGKLFFVFTDQIMSY